MEYGRKIIYFTVYENGIKVRPGGYMTICTDRGSCEVEIVYRGSPEEDTENLQVVYLFSDGTVFTGDKFVADSGTGKIRFRSSPEDFAGSGRSIPELEAVCLDGIKQGVCIGRTDGKEPSEAACTKNECKENRKMPTSFLLCLLLILCSSRHFIWRQKQTFPLCIGYLIIL